MVVNYPSNQMLKEHFLTLVKSVVIYQCNLVDL